MSDYDDYLAGCEDDYDEGDDYEWYDDSDNPDDIRAEENGSLTLNDSSDYSDIPF